MENLDHLSDENNRAILIKRLHSLNSSIDKAQFWYKGLKLNYLDLSDSDSFRDIPLKPFKFDIPDNEKKKFAHWVIDNYLILSNYERKFERQLQLDKMIFDFDRSLEKEE